jgi:5'(3')-deoxyribonucleotidase
MDGVIADYIVGMPKDYHKKRPLYDSIRKLEEISKLSNVELYIFSSSRFNDGIEQKNKWLDEHAPFFKKENRIILSREANNMVKSSTLKANFFTDYNDDSVLIVIDDDPRVLKEIAGLNKNIILLKDTVLVD